MASNWVHLQVGDKWREYNEKRKSEGARDPRDEHIQVIGETCPKPLRAIEGHSLLRYQAMQNGCGILEIITTWRTEKEWHQTLFRAKCGLSYSALLWQKEASDIPSKFELLMFS